MVAFTVTFEGIGNDDWFGELVCINLFVFYIVVVRCSANPDVKALFELKAFLY